MASFVILDNGAAGSLLRAGGLNGLQQLTQTHTSVIIPSIIFDEMFPTGTGGILTQNQQVLLDWINNSGQVQIEHFTINDDDVKRFNKGWSPGQKFDKGDIAIKKFIAIQVGFGSDDVFDILTDNNKDFKNFEKYLERNYGKNVPTKVFTSTFEYLGASALAGNMTYADYRRSVDNILASDRGGQINQSAILSKAEFDRIRSTGSLNFAASNNIISLKSALNGLGFVGDAAGIIVTAIEIVQLHQNGNSDAAVKLLVKEIGGLAGGAAGGVGGAVLALAILAVLVPEPGTTAAGIAVLAGAFAGGAAGDAAGSALAEALVDKIREKLESGEDITLDDFTDIISALNPFCFLAGTPVTLPDGSTAPIETLRVGDWVTAYDSYGTLVPAQVSAVHRNRVEHVLDVHGLMVTPGHVTLCGDGPYAGMHVPIIDILRTDGALVREDNSKVRAATGVPLGHEDDGFVWAVTGERQADGSTCVTDKRRIRLGTRITTASGAETTVHDVIRRAGGQVTEAELVRHTKTGTQAPFLWVSDPSLPRPEDYVLRKSGLTLFDLYDQSGTAANDLSMRQ